MERNLLRKEELDSILSSRLKAGLLDDASALVSSGLGEEACTLSGRVTYLLVAIATDDMATAVA